MYNFHRFSRFWEPPERLSVLELVNTGTLDLHLAGLLWLMMEQRSSVIVSAGPNFAGKTTVLNMLLDFLLPAVRQVHLRGNYEDFKFTEGARPSETYMVAEEFNTYFNYVWGDVARKAFQLLTQGYGLGGTIHARTPQEVVYILHRYLGLPLPVVSHLDAIINLRVTWGKTYGFEPLRQIESVSLLIPEDDSITLEILAIRPPEEDNIEFVDSERLQRAFSVKYNAEYNDIEHEIAVREKILGQLIRESRVSHQNVREVILEFYKSHYS